MADRITINRATVEQALEALEWSWGGEPIGTMERDAITALKAALAQQAEPVQRKPLTEEEIKPLVQRAMTYYGYAPERYGLTASAGFEILVRAIEAAHGIKEAK